MEEIKLPQLGQSVEEAQIVEWFKKEGDPVQAGEPLFSVQTDKAEIEVECTATGILRKILVEPGDDVPVRSVVAWVGTADEALPDLPAGTRTPAQSSREVPAPSAPVQAVATSLSAPAASGDGARVSPRARRAARESHIDAERLSGTGAEGRVIEADVLAYAARLDTAAITPTARRIAAAAGLEATAIAGTGPRGKITKSDILAAAKPQTSPSAPRAGGRRIPLSPMRRIIAERMAASKFTAPHYYVTVEVDMTACKLQRASASAFKPSFNDFVLFAAARALAEYPAVNARWAGDAIEEGGEVHLGMAVALPTGLIVPVIRRADTLSLAGLSATARALAEKAQKGKLLPDDYQGSTFTVSNLGAFGVEQFTAIINQPDSAILAVGQIKDRVVVIDGGIHIRPIMKMTLSSDHRVIDGAVAAQFMGRVKSLLEAGAFS